MALPCTKYAKKRINTNNAKRQDRIAEQMGADLQENESGVYSSLHIRIDTDDCHPTLTTVRAQHSVKSRSDQLE